MYECDAKGVTASLLLGELPIEPEAYAIELLVGAERRRDSIDELIGRYSEGWSVDRMPVVDRSVLRLATFELLDERAVPVAVVIDEAVELVKSYSTEDSGRFVNGVLSAIAAEVRERDGLRA